MSNDQTTKDAGVILPGAMFRRAETESYIAALKKIRDLPMPGLDNMISAKMRRIAKEALGEL